MTRAMIIKRSLSEKDLRRELEQFELEYKVLSHRLTEAFLMDGRLVETPAFARWSSVWTAYRRLEGQISHTSGVAEVDLQVAATADHDDHGQPVVYR